VDGRHPTIDTFLIRPRFWKKVAQHGRIIEDALYLDSHGKFGFGPKSGFKMRPVYTSVSITYQHPRFSSSLSIAL